MTNETEFPTPLTNEAIMDALRTDRKAQDNLCNLVNAIRKHVATGGTDAPVFDVNAAVHIALEAAAMFVDDSVEFDDGLNEAVCSAADEFLSEMDDRAAQTRLAEMYAFHQPAAAADHRNDAYTEQHGWNIR